MYTAYHYDEFKKKLHIYIKNIKKNIFPLKNSEQFNNIVV